MLVRRAALVVVRRAGLARAQAALTVLAGGLVLVLVVVVVDLLPADRRRPAIEALFQRFAVADPERDINLERPPEIAFRRGHGPGELRIEQRQRLPVGGPVGDILGQQLLVFGLARKGDEAVGVGGLRRTLRDGPAVDVVEASAPRDLEVFLALPLEADPQRIR